MTIYQLSIFIENRSGALVKVLRILKQAGIQIVASTVADTTDYGIYRLICSDPARACEKLREGGISVALSDVFALELDNEPGRASDAIEAFEKANVSIAYLYSFMLRGKGVLIFRTDDIEKAREIILENNLRYITEPDLSKLV